MDGWMNEETEDELKVEEGEGEEMVSMLFKSVEGKTTGRTQDQWKDRSGGGREDSPMPSQQRGDMREKEKHGVRERNRRKGGRRPRALPRVRDRRVRRRAGKQSKLRAYGLGAYPCVQSATPSHLLFSFPLLSRTDEKDGENEQKTREESSSGRPPRALCEWSLPPAALPLCARTDEEARAQILLQENTHTQNKKRQINPLSFPTPFPLSRSLP